MVLAAVRARLAYSARQEEDYDDGRRDPEGSVEIGVSVEHVEEVGAGVQGRSASPDEVGGVDVEELRVVG